VITTSSATVGAVGCSVKCTPFIVPRQCDRVVVPRRKRIDTCFRHGRMVYKRTQNQLSRLTYVFIPMDLVTKVA
jgi:hypothetical protein